jgi:hypothetical protein
MNTRTFRHPMVMVVFAAFAGVAGVIWFTGGVVSFPAPEISLSLATIAGLIWLALIDLREGAPRNFDHGGVSRRFRRDFVRPRAKQVRLWHRRHRLAA